MDDFVCKFKQFSKKYKIFKPAQNIVCFFSGGADSSFLLDILLTLQNEMKFNLKVYSILCPPEVYTKKNIKNLKNYWEAKVFVNFINMPKEILSKYIKNKCEVCKEYRINTTKEIIQKSGNFTFVSGFTKDDLLHYYFSFFLKEDKYYHKEQKLRRLLRFETKQNC